jgi:hypothetical protein
MNTGPGVGLGLEGPPGMVGLNGFWLCVRMHVTVRVEYGSWFCVSLYGSVGLAGS